MKEMKLSKSMVLLLFVIVVGVTGFIHSSLPVFAAKNPENLEKAEKLFGERKYAEAKAAYSEYIKDNPKDYRGFFGRGKTWIKLFNRAPAFYDLNQAVSLETKDAELYRTRGKLQLERGEFAAALKDLNMALSKGAQDKLDIFEDRAEAYRLLGNQKQQIEQLDEILAKKQTPALYRKRADSYYALRNYEKAIDDYSKCLDDDPESYKLRLRRGYCYEKIKDWQHAIDDYTKLIDKDQKDYVVLERRAVVYYESGDMKKALEDISKAIYHFRGYSAKSLYLLRAKIYQKTGQGANAAKDFAKVNTGRRKKK